MKHRTSPAIATVALFFSLATSGNAAQLVADNGQPIGGQLQSWVNLSRVPTVRGALGISTDSFALTISDPIVATICGGAPGCSTPGFVWLVYPNVNAPDTLYFELGHQFDWRYLTNADRRVLARSWGLGRWHWANTTAGLLRGAEDGLQGVFAAIYKDCAEGVNDEGGSLVLWEPGGPPQANPSSNTCVYIDRVARRLHADMEASSLAPWNRQHHSIGRRPASSTKTSTPQVA